MLILLAFKESFNSLSRDHEIAGEIEERVASYIFQLPLSGSLESLISDIVGIGLLCLSTPSLGITHTPMVRQGRGRSTRFQLPLSGSQEPDKPHTREARARKRLSTPSLGITWTGG